MTVQEVCSITHLSINNDYYVVVQDSCLGTYDLTRNKNVRLVSGIPLPGVTWEDVIDQEVKKIIISTDRDGNTRVDFIVETSNKVSAAYHEGRIKPTGYYPTSIWGGYITGEVDGEWYFRTAGICDEKWRRYDVHQRDDDDDDRKWAYDVATGKDIFPMDEVMRCSGM